MAEVSAKAVMELREKTGVSMMACKKALQEASGDFEKAIEVLRKSGAEKAIKKADRETGEGAVAVAGHAVVSVRCETDFVARNEQFLAFLQHLAEVADKDGAAAAEKLFETERAGLVAKLGENISFGEARVLTGGTVVGSYVHSNRKFAGIVALEGGNDELARDLAMHVVASSPEVLTPEEIPASLVSKEKEIWTDQLKREGKPEAIIEKIMLGKEKKFREENALIKQPFVKNQEITVEALLGQSGAKAAGFLRVKV